jgi:hypothetical protein
MRGIGALKNPHSPPLPGKGEVAHSCAVCSIYCSMRTGNSPNAIFASADRLPAWHLIVLLLKSPTPGRRRIYCD